MSWPHVAAPLLAARCPELLAELRALTSWTLAAELGPADVVHVIAWALDAPDLAAARLRLEHRAWRRGPTDRAKVPRFRPLWLLDRFCWAERLAAAQRWGEQGRPVAADALQAAVEGPEVHTALTRRAEALWGQITPRDPTALGARPRGMTAARELAEGRVWLELQLLLDAGVIDEQGHARAYQPARPVRRGGRGGSFEAAGAALATFPQGGEP